MVDFMGAFAGTLDMISSFVKEKLLGRSTRQQFPNVPSVPVCFDYRTYLGKSDLAPSGFLRPELEKWLDDHGVSVVQHKTGNANRPLVLYFETLEGWQLFENEAPYNRH